MHICDIVLFVKLGMVKKMEASYIPFNTKLTIRQSLAPPARPEFFVKCNEQKVSKDNIPIITDALYYIGHNWTYKN